MSKLIIKRIYRGNGKQNGKSVRYYANINNLEANGIISNRLYNANSHVSKHCYTLKQIKILFNAYAITQ